MYAHKRHEHQIRCSSSSPLFNRVSPLTDGACCSRLHQVQIQLSCTADVMVLHAGLIGGIVPLELIVLLLDAECLDEAWHCSVCDCSGTKLVCLTLLIHLLLA